MTKMFCDQCGEETKVSYYGGGVLTGSCEKIGTSAVENMAGTGLWSFQIVVRYDNKLSSPNSNRHLCLRCLKAIVRPHILP